MVDTIAAQGTNEFQEFVKEVAKEEEYRGCKVFVDYGLNEDGSILSTWSQQDVFVAEAYGDYECVDDGMMGLMLKSVIEGKQGIVFVSEEVCQEYKTFYEEKELIHSQKGYRAYLVNY